MATSEGRDRADREKYAQLLEQAGRATVGIRAAPGAGPGPLWGSGVFIAPGWVLTCAHVLVSSDGRRRETGKDGEIGVVFEGRVAGARLEYDLSRPAGGAGRAGGPGRPDLALVRLLEPYPEHRCAWLSDQHAALLEDAYIFRGHDQLGGSGAWGACGHAGAPGDARDSGDAHDPGGAYDPGDAYDSAGAYDSGGAYGQGGAYGRGGVYVPGGAHGPGRAPIEAGVRQAPVDPFIAVRFGARDARGLQFGSDVRVTPGASGGPLLDCDRGEVVGIVKGRHQEDKVGLAVPVTALRALGPQHLLPGRTGLGPDPYHELMSLHDRWHWAGQDLGRRGEPTWFDAQYAIMAGRERLWGVAERLQALDLLARLPAPRDPLVVEAAVCEVLGGRDRAGTWSLRTWRDGHGVLYQGSDPYSERCAFVHYLRIVAQRTSEEVRGVPGEEAARVREAAERLARFVTDKAAVLLPKDRRRIGPVPRRPDAVLVEFEPLFYGDGGQQLFNWSVSEGYGRGEWMRVDLQESEGGMTFEQAQAQVLRRLGPRLLRADGDVGPGGRVRLEVAVPEGYWQLPADRWAVPVSTRAGARARPIGSGRPVVLRDQGRRQAVDPAWLRRWRGLMGAPELSALRVPPRAGGGPESVWRLLENGEEGAVPTLCRSVAVGTGLDAVGAALDAGYPVSLWLSEGHDERECDSACDDFHREVRDLLAAKGVTALPELVRELRGRAEETSAHWARDLVLLYDDPDNPIPQLFAGGPQLSSR
ncbi:serine protease [Streptomyces sp. MST-110588]|uniref:serine protease n=1 Tax=Streptomyces sp. MST-110588 TaxID=2833628 RepID=UPI001F5D9853|nr:serine protease [Streptomyces sp. MST-110588]UNO39966.1 trypsin-like peptidase domain-containing protein [Streptomyces sp. MST-110588]